VRKWDFSQKHLKSIFRSQRFDAINHRLFEFLNSEKKIIKAIMKKNMQGKQKQLKISTCSELIVWKCKTNVKCGYISRILKLKYVEWELQTLIKVNYQTLLFAIEDLRSWKLIQLFVTRFKERQALWFTVVVRMTLLANVLTICDKSRIDVFAVCSYDIMSCVTSKHSHRMLLKLITSVKLIKQSHQNV